MPIPKIKMSKGMLAYVSRERNKVEKEAPKTKECPRCERKREFHFFGVRTHRDPKTGEPVRFSPQSYCVDCRSKKPEAKKVVAKITAAKKTPKVAAKAKAAKLPKTVVVAKASQVPDPEMLALVSSILGPTAAANAPLAMVPATEPVIPLVEEELIAAQLKLLEKPMAQAPAAPVVQAGASVAKSGKRRKLLIVDVPEAKK